MTCKQGLAALAAAGMLSACGSDDGAADRGDAVPADARASETAAETTAMPRSPAPDGARLFFVTPNDGDTVGNPVRVEFGLEGMNIAEAGTNQPNSGHHHLIIDADLPDLSMPIPRTENYVHFGDGGTSTEITLEPGEHTLRLLLGDHLHVPHKPPVYSDEITITVE